MSSCRTSPGAAGLASVNKIGTTADRDGRTILVMSRALPQLALVGDPNAAFDPLTLTWLGSLSSYKDDAYLMTINASHPAKSLADLQTPAKPVHLGGTSGGSTNIIFALIARDMLKLNVGITKGYPGAAQIWLAMERGEVDGQFLDISAIMVGRPTLWKEGKLRPLMGFGRTERHPDLPVVPIARELVSDPGRPCAAGFRRAAVLHGAAAGRAARNSRRSGARAQGCVHGDGAQRRVPRRHAQGRHHDEPDRRRCGACADRPAPPKAPEDVRARFRNAAGGEVSRPILARTSNSNQRKG